MNQTNHQERFTISEVAADWHELMIDTMGHYAAIPASSSKHWTHGATSRHTTAPVSCIRPSPRSP